METAARCNVSVLGDSYSGWGRLVGQGSPVLLLGMTHRHAHDLLRTTSELVLLSQCGGLGSEIRLVWLVLLVL